VADSSFGEKDSISTLHDNIFFLSQQQGRWGRVVVERPAEGHRELNTCGNCQEGYIGIPTHSNTLCTPRESLQKRIGEACGDLNASCSNGFCNESLKVCTEHLKQCPFASSSEGHGRCVLCNGLRESLAKPFASAQAATVKENKEWSGNEPEKKQYKDTSTRVALE
jgi:hypothetical protein